MPILAGLNVNGNDIGGAWFGRVYIVVVRGTSKTGLLDEVKEVLVRASQSVAFWSRHGVGFVPNQIVSQNPASLLHSDSKTRRNE